MSGYDYMYRSSYGHNTHTRVMKIKTYVEKVDDPRVVEYSQLSPIKLEHKSIHNYDRPPEVQNLITKILDEVNGPAIGTIDPKSRGYYCDPVRVESRSDYVSDPKYESSPISGMHRPWYEDIRGGSPQEYGVFGHCYDRQPLREYDYAKNKWGKSSHPVYSEPPNEKSYGPGNQYGNSSIKSDASKKDGLFHNHWGDSHGFDSPKYEVVYDQGVPDNQWENSPTKLQTRNEYGDHVHPSHLKLKASKDERDPNYQWGDSPKRTQFTGNYAKPNNYRVPINQWDNSHTKPLTQQEYGDYNDPSHFVINTSRDPNNQGDDFPIKSQTGADYNSPKSYRVPIYQWSNSPTKSHAQREYGGHNNPSHFKSRDESDPNNNQWGGIPRRTQAVMDDTTSKNYRDPVNQWGNSPRESRVQNDYSIANNPLHPKPETMNEGQGTPRNKWGSSPMNSHNVGDTRGPDKQWGSSLTKSPIQQDNAVPFKPESPRDQGHPYNQWSNLVDTPYVQGKNGDPNDKQSTSSSLDYKNSPMNSPKSSRFVDRNNQWSKPSNPAYDHPSNTTSPLKSKAFDDSISSPTKGRTHQNYGTPNDPWDRSSSFDKPQPPLMTCKDGVCTLGDKPKTTYSPYEKPNSQDNHNQPNKTSSGHQVDNGNDRCHDNQLDKDHHDKNVDWMKPSAKDNVGTSTPFHSIRKALGKLTTDSGASSKGGIGKPSSLTSLMSPNVGFSSLAHQGQQKQNLKDSKPEYIDSREAAKRYGGESVPLRPYSSEEDNFRPTITSEEVVKKYNGSRIPN